ncbi:MAG: sel1 repeat family protein, partial [Myxococcales bacterium]|nr:sel1 repeat family protein [Myxococcales bacterium]
MLRALALRPPRLAHVLPWLLLPALGCKAGAVADEVRPPDPSATEALGRGACTGVTEGAEPLVVDWMPEQRGDLEVAMRDGVAVVAYSCDALRLLPDCHIAGTYGFIGMTRKEQVVRLANDDEVRVNLPLSQGKIGGELTRDASIDVAMIMVGKQRTTWQDPTVADLQGSCEGATHYVRGATVGAFVVELSTAANARVAAEMFEVGASAGSSSAKETRNQDGDPNDCAKASPDASEPPPQCGAPIRLVLAPIAQAEAEAESVAEPSSLAGLDHACPSGLVLAEGKCTSAEQAQSYQCSPDDRGECEAQCGRGHAGSCTALGVIQAAGGEHSQAADSWRKACDGGDALGCANLGVLTERGQGTTQDPAAAAQLFERGCDGGVAVGCEGLGRAVLSRAGGRKADP